MARYIDADKADVRTIHSSYMGYSSQADVFDWLQSQPTADVVEVKHGEWVSTPIKEKGYDSKSIPTCTICGYQSFITYTYCPECGAKMDGRRDT